MVATTEVLMDNLSRVYEKLDDLGESLQEFKVDQTKANGELRTEIELLKARIPTISPKWVIAGIVVLLLAGASIGERAWSYADRWLDPPVVEKLVVGERASR